MPLSSTQTRTPAPVPPPIAQSRVTRSGHEDGIWIASPAAAAAGRLQAGRSSSVSCARTLTGRPCIPQPTRRLCIDRLRAPGREAPADPETLEPNEVDETLAQLDEAMSLRAGLDAVGDACREILDRFFARDESYRTIGEAL